MIHVEEIVIDLAVERLDIPPILVNMLSLPLLPLLRQVSLTDPVEERYYVKGRF
jgi:hypothetical protein